MRFLCSKPKKYKQQGLSLIELLVALSLGIFLVAGVIQVFIGSRQSFNVIHANSVMQEAGRFAAHFLSTTTRHAGYINVGENIATLDVGAPVAEKLANLVQAEEARAINWPQENGFIAGAVVAGENNSAAAGTKAGTDRLSVRLQGDSDGLMFDCRGAEISKAEENMSWVTFFVDDNDQLNCTVDSSNAVQPTTIALVDGVENMQVLYGVVSDLNFPNQVSKYVSVVANDEWPMVASVTIGLLTKSDNTPLDTVNKTYNLLGESITVADGHSRQMFTQTITLRNRISGI